MTYQKTPQYWRVKNPLLTRIQADAQRVGHPHILRQVENLPDDTPRRRLIAIMTTLSSILKGDLSVMLEEVTL